MPAKSISILIIDSDEIQTRGLKRAMEAYTSNITIVSNPLEALSCVEKDNFQLIISELNFAIIDGLELIYQLRKKQPKADIWVCSGHMTAHTEKLLETIGIQHIFEKPFDLRELNGEIKQLI